MIEIFLVLAFLITFGVFIAAVALGTITEHRRTRQAVRSMEEGFDEIVSRLGDEEGGRR